MSTAAVGRYGVPRTRLHDFHAPRLELLAAAGPDLFAVETIPDTDEAEVLAWRARWINLGLSWKGLEKLGAPGIELLHPSSRDCIRTAHALYAGILDVVERSGYRVLDRRVSVPVGTRLRVALPTYVRARLAR